METHWGSRSIIGRVNFVRSIKRRRLPRLRVILLITVPATAGAPTVQRAEKLGLELDSSPYFHLLNLYAVECLLRCAIDWDWRRLFRFLCRAIYELWEHSDSRNDDGPRRPHGEPSKLRGALYGVMGPRQHGRHLGRLYDRRGCVPDHDRIARQDRDRRRRNFSD